MTMYTTLGSPVGELLLVAERSASAPGGVALAALSMPEQRGAATIQPGWVRDDAAFSDIAAQIAAYFAGDLKEFDLEFAGQGTAFQARVWREVEQIPFGASTTYGRIAEAIGAGREDAVKVGAAVGANPLLLVRPCHRVLGADGSLKGYEAGIARKRLLLEHEGVLPAPLA